MTTTRTRSKGKSGRASADGGAEAEAGGGPSTGTAAPVPVPPVGESGPGLEETVTAYLLAHRDFLARRPEVLAQLRVPHGAGGAVSLIEHQVKVLRGQLETERARLNQLIARARDYESFSTRLHSLVLQLITAADLAQVQAVLYEALRREFSAEAVTLRLLPPADSALPDALTAAFQDFLALARTRCGPLEDPQGELLFGAAAGELRCAALVPIQVQGAGRSGVLAIGASDPQRFRPDMGTDLLDRLGEIVSHKLRVLPLDGPSAPSDPEGEPEPDPSPLTEPPKPKPARRKRAKASAPADPPAGPA